MDDNLKVLLELEKRGALPPEHTAVLNELRRRGAIPGATPAQPMMPPASGMFTPGPRTPAHQAVNRQAAGDIAAGILRAPQAFVEGAGALVQDAVITPAVRAKAGSVAAEEASQRFHGAVQDMRAADEQANPGSVVLGDIAAGVAPMGQISRGGKVVDTLRGAVGRGVAAGTVGSQLPYQGPDQRGTNAALGAGLGGAIPLSTKLGDAVWNAAARAVMRRRDPQTQQMFQDAQKAFVDPVTGQPLQGADDYFAAQVAGDPRLSRLAGTSADTLARDAVRKQLDQRVANVRKVADSMGGPKTILTDEKRAKAFYTVVDNEDRLLRVERNSTYQKDLAKLEASPEGRALRVPVQPMLDEMDVITREVGDLVEIAKKGGASEKAIEVLEQIPALKGKGAQLKLPAYKDLTVILNEGRSFGSAIVSDPHVARWNMVRGRLAQALDRSASGLPPGSPGAAEFKRITGEYAARSEGIRRLENDIVVRLFGDEGVLADPDKAFDAFINASPSAQALGINILSKRSPELLGYMKQRYLDTVLDEATSGAAPAMQSSLNPEKLYKGLTDSKIMKSPLFTAEEKRWMAAAGSDLKVILNSLPDTTKVGTDLTLADISINLVSRSPEFMTRLLARAATGVGLENILFTPEGRKALMTVRNLSKASDQAKQAAAGYLVGLVNSEPDVAEPAPVGGRQ